jgi:hypothetical protein
MEDSIIFAEVANQLKMSLNLVNIHAQKRAKENKMPEELLDKKFQNFYINEDGVICGIVTPKEIWKITEPQELKDRLESHLLRCNTQLIRMSNYEPLLKSVARYEKMLKQLNSAITKQGE